MSSTRLRARNLALCIADSETRETPIVPTADYAYLRLRDEGYGDADIAQWTETAKQLARARERRLRLFQARRRREGRGVRPTDDETPGTDLMKISDLGSRISDRLKIAGCVIAATMMLAGCNQTPVAEAPTTAKPAIDVVELSATDARDRMAAGQLTSEALTKAYLDRIADDRRCGAEAGRGDRDQPEGRRRCRRARRRTQGRQGARAAARHPDADQGQRRRRRHGQFRRLAGARRQPARGRRVHGDAPARGGRGDSRQDQPQRVGQLPLDALVVRLELARRADEESLRARSQSLRFEFGHRHARSPPALARLVSAPKPTAASSARPR